jgi:hypothetical protein
MGKQCQRPDCSEPASVAYRFDPANQLVVLDGLRGSLDPESGALCMRHASTMVLPRGWWLDDRRQTIPTLFANIRRDLEQLGGAVPEVPRARRTGARRTRAVDAPLIEPTAVSVPGQVVAGVVESVDEVVVPAVVTAAEPVVAAVVEAIGVPAVEAAADPVVEPVADPVVEASVESGETDDGPVVHAWTPDFDAHDDLDGLLNATSPLLSRAFSGRRPRRGSPT